ncbi:MAG: biotin--[acetyl-CoA-carboxylase] ligase [Bacteroidota bacterium]
MALFTGKHIVRLETADSTNQVAQEMIGPELPEGSVILTYHQTRGRGQQGNRWASPAGQNLTFSLVYYPLFLPVKDVFALSKVAALGVHASLQALVPEQDVWIKWPNDLLLNGRKTAGILIENQLQARGVAATVIGIGLNVNQQVFTPDLPLATSLYQETSESFDLERVLDVVLNEVERYYLLLRNGQRSLIDRAYLQALYQYQELTKVRIGTEVYMARIMGINSTGQLGILVEDEPSIRYFAVKEVHVMLPGEG